MSEAASAAVVAPATNTAPVVNADIADGGGEFDRAAAFAEYQKVTDSEGDGTSRLDVKDFDPNEEPPTEETAAEPKPEDLTEEERIANRRKKLSDEKGKLSQDKLDGAFAKLTAEGKRLRGKVEALKGERAAFEKLQADHREAIETAATRVNKTEAEWNEHAEKAKTEPLTVLEKLGWDWDKLVRYVQNNGKVAPEDAMKSAQQTYEQKLAAQAQELKDLKDSLSQRDMKSEASQYEQRAVATMESLITAAGSKYELVKNYDLKTEIAPKVLQNIAAIYREGGTLGSKTYPKGTALDPATVLDHFEAQEAKALARHGYRPGQAGAASSAAKLGAAKPKASLSNADTSSRALRQPAEDATEFDREDALRQVQNLFS